MSWRTKPQQVLLAAVAIGLLTACGSSDDGADDGITEGAITDTPSPSEPTDSPSADAPSADATVSEEPVPEAAVDDVIAQLVELSSSEAFAGDNSDESIAAAARAFNEAGLDFSPSGLAAGVPTACTGIDTVAVSQILGTQVSAETIEGFLAASPGYLSCTLQSTVDPKVAMAYVHLAPDLAGEDNWGVIGTLDGAFDITGLADAAVWSDGSRSDNQTNPGMLQLQVDQGGTQSLIQAQANEPQLALVEDWSVPRLILALAAVDASLT